MVGWGGVWDGEVTVKGSPQATAKLPPRREMQTSQSVCLFMGAGNRSWLGERRGLPSCSVIWKPLCHKRMPNDSIYPKRSSIPPNGPFHMHLKHSYTRKPHNAFCITVLSSPETGGGGGFAWMCACVDLSNGLFSTEQSHHCLLQQEYTAQANCFGHSVKCHIYKCFPRSILLQKQYDQYSK